MNIPETSVVHPSAIIHEDCIIGENCRIYENVVIGAIGTALTRGDSGIVTKEFHGKVIIEDNVTVHAGSIIIRGEKTDTIIGTGSVIGLGCIISHDVRIGSNVMVLNDCHIYGYTVIEDNVRIRPGSMIMNRLTIGTGSQIGAGALVMHDVPTGITVYGRPARPRRDLLNEREKALDILGIRPSDPSESKTGPKPVAVKPLAKPRTRSARRGRSKRRKPGKKSRKRR
jgi:UDP-3-O-[3-hydroxymyristoyl] glucosamine N-acyltransferase